MKYVLPVALNEFIPSPWLDDSGSLMQFDALLSNPILEVATFGSGGAVPASRPSIVVIVNMSVSTGCGFQGGLELSLDPLGLAHVQFFEILAGKIRYIDCIAVELPTAGLNLRNTLGDFSCELKVVTIRPQGVR